MFSFAGFGFRASFFIFKSRIPRSGGDEVSALEKPDGFQVAIFVGEN